MTRGDRYARLFRRLAADHEGAFIPFVILGDPGPRRSLRIVRALVEAGADALELGFPFSDPIADGPVIQAAAVRALRAGTRRADCWRIVREARHAHPDLPIGLLVYANLVLQQEPAAFYAAAAEAGADSVLVADLPVAESGPVVAAARNAGICPVFIAPPNAGDARLQAIAVASEAYTYVTSREGVTGMDETLRRTQQGLIARLRELGAPPPVLGFGIAKPDHVKAALAMGAAGAISGSAVVRRIADHLDDQPAIEKSVAAFAREMKEATL